MDGVFGSKGESSTVPVSKALLDLAYIWSLFVHTYFIRCTKRESEVDFWGMCLCDSWCNCPSVTAVSSDAELVRMLLVQEVKPRSDKLNLTRL